MEVSTKTIIKFFLIPLVFANLAVFAASTATKIDFLMHVDFLDVGQGDSIFIQTYQGNQIVIDGGPTDKVLSQLGKVMPFSDRSLDLLILTHPDLDHVSGLIDALKHFKVEKVLFTGVAADTGAFRQFLAELENEKAEKIYAKAGQRIWLDDSTVFDVYYPPSGIADTKLATNDTSIIGKLSFGQTSILFTGDVTSKIEDSLIAPYNLDSDMLKVAHHGSRFSTSASFLQEVTPNFAVIQVGKNSYGHPTEEVLTRLKTANAYVLRNDQQGLIRFVSDGQRLYRK